MSPPWGRRLYGAMRYWQYITGHPGLTWAQWDWNSDAKWSSIRFTMSWLPGISIISSMSVADQSQYIHVYSHIYSICFFNSAYICCFQPLGRTFDVFLVRHQSPWLRSSWSWLCPSWILWFPMLFAPLWSNPTTHTSLGSSNDYPSIHPSESNESLGLDGLNPTHSIPDPSISPSRTT